MRIPHFRSHSAPSRTRQKRSFGICSRLPYVFNLQPFFPPRSAIAATPPVIEDLPQLVFCCQMLRSFILYSSFPPPCVTPLLPTQKEQKGCGRHFLLTSRIDLPPHTFPLHSRLRDPRRILRPPFLGWPGITSGWDFTLLALHEKNTKISGFSIFYCLTLLLPPCYFPTGPLFRPLD